MNVNDDRYSLAETRLQDARAGYLQAIFASLHHEPDAEAQIKLARSEIRDALAELDTLATT